MTTYNWDSNNRLLSIGDGLGNVTSFAYVTNCDQQGRDLRSITQPLGGIFTYTYNSSGQVSSYADQLGGITTPGLERGGYRIAAIDPLGNRTSYSYSSLGQLGIGAKPARARR